MSFKRKLHDAWPEAYDAALRLWRSRFAWWLRSLPTAARDRRQMAQNAPLFLVDIKSRMGLGAMLTNTLKILHYCDSTGMMPFVRFTNPLYAKNPASGEDWLEKFFVRKIRPDDVASLGFNRFIDYNATVQAEIDQYIGNQSPIDLNHLFFRYMDIRQEFWDQANQFCAAAGIGPPTLGVHYRGTDKKLETPRVSWDAMQKAIDRHLELEPNANVFVATDEPEFLVFMNSIYGKDRVIDLDCKEIYDGSRAPHVTSGDGYLKASEALLSLLVLSMCGYCIRTPSHLSLWSKIIKPDLDMTILTGGYDGERLSYPENIVWRISQKA